MGHSSVTIAFRFAALATAALCAAGVERASAQPTGNGPQGQGGPVYQRRAFDSRHGPRNKPGDLRRDKDKFGRKDHRFFNQRFVPQSPSVQSRWFQRPYPYHLDYYRMKYGGSYAPYFGNLYGPPQVVTAPPYYGPYYGGWGYENGGGGWGYENGGWDPRAGGYPPGAYGAAPVNPGEVVEDEPAVESGSNNSSAAQSNGERLPAPAE